ncbi:uncharacterized protein LOC119695576 [Motacilla alba alba]|uniref:uncharacterized protein LOC119695576 n=1 Tax=Motacilla alba alba TaxID=1094192 RepID=UPI0018D55ADD|nr:uncharacterized protein LOC119695576 [Motacilla alba alba]
MNRRRELNADDVAVRHSSWSSLVDFPEGNKPFGLHPRVRILFSLAPSVLCRLLARLLTPVEGAAPTPRRIRVVPPAARCCCALSQPVLPPPRCRGSRGHSTQQCGSLAPNVGPPKDHRTPRQEASGRGESFVSSSLTTFRSVVVKLPCSVSRPRFRGGAPDGDRIGNFATQEPIREGAADFEVFPHFPLVRGCIWLSQLTSRTLSAGSRWSRSRHQVLGFGSEVSVLW